MARKINLSSPEILKKLGSPSIMPKTTTAMYNVNAERKRSCSQDYSMNIQMLDSNSQDPKNRSVQTANRVHEKCYKPFKSFPSKNTPRVSGPDLSRTTGRDFMGIYNNNQHQREYNPNYNTVWKGTGKKILTFRANLPRKEFFKAPEFVIELKDVKYSQVDPKVAIPNLKKTTARSTDEAVPSFMVNIHYLDRVTGHTVPNYKSLKMNNYMNTTFLPQQSSFDTRLKSKQAPRHSRTSSPFSKYESID